MAAAMIMGLGITTMAAPNTGGDGKFGTSDDTATISVSGVEHGCTVKAYQIIKAKYENTGGQFSGYEAMYVTDPAISITPGASVTITQDQMDQLEKMTLDEAEPVTMNWKEATSTYEADVAPGTYLVRVTDSETHIYNTMVVSVYYTETGLDEEPLNVTNVEAKKIEHPDLTKKVDGVDGNSAEIGDTVNYEITVNPIPHYSGNYPVFNIEDKLSAGLTYVEGSLKVEVEDSGEINGYESSVSGQTITIDFVTDDGYILNDYTGKSMTITYSATVNGSATVNEVFNNNDAELKYTKDSKINSAVEPNIIDTDEDKTYTYTFEIDGDLSGTTDIITKVGDKTGDTTGLNGAEFALYKQDPDTTPGAQVFKTATTSTVASKKGQMTFRGLEAGTTYYLKETKAPNGYSLNTKVYTVKIEAEYYSNTDSGITKDNYGKLKSWVVKVDDQEVASFTVTNEAKVDSSSITGADIQNTTISTLPSTGGIGTTIFTIGGIVIMVAAAALYFANRRKNNG